MRVSSNLGFILLAIWLIIEGLLSITGGSAVSVLLGILAVAAGVLILLPNLDRKRR